MQICNFWFQGGTYSLSIAKHLDTHQQVLVENSLVKHLKTHHPKFWRSTRTVQCWVMPSVYLHNECDPLHIAQTRMLSTLGTLLYTNINIQRRKRKKFILTEKAQQTGTLNVSLQPTHCFLFHSINVLRLFRRIPGVLGSSFKSFNHWLPQTGFNKHRCVLSIFVCSTMSGNQPTH